MTSRIALLKKLVTESRYPLDEAAVAEAIILRRQARGLIPNLAFRIEEPEPRVRSFRAHRGARSFRLTRAPRRLSDRRASPAARASRPSWR